MKASDPLSNATSVSITKDHSINNNNRNDTKKRHRPQEDQLTAVDDEDFEEQEGQEQTEQQILQQQQQQQQQQRHQQQLLRLYHLYNDYYQRLLYQCHKDLQKNVKRIKNFIIQKQIRIIKTSSKTTKTVAQEDPTSLSNRNDTDTDANHIENDCAKKQQQQQQQQQQASREEMKLLAMKEWNDIASIITECDRRLGIVQLHPKFVLSMIGFVRDVPETDNKDSNNDCTSPDSKTSDNIASNGHNHNDDDSRNNNMNDQDDDVAPSKINTTSKNIHSLLFDRIMKHTSMISVLEHWHNEVTKYRIWSLQQQERYLSDQPYTGSNDNSTKRSSSSSANNNNNSNKRSKTNNATKKKMKKTNGNAPMISNDIQNSIFVSLNGGDKIIGQEMEDDDDDNDSNNPYSHYGPAGQEQNNDQRKKNRQGQRGRRAKMAAIEAKKQGRTIEESLNWRGGGGGSTDKKKNQQQSLFSSSATASSTNNNSSSYNRRNHSNNSNNELAPRTKAPTVANSTAYGSTTNLPQQPHQDEVLHPSWQAKKERKDTIVAFQGTKITFQDDD